jgi:uncharacterized protein (TIGR01244 family)
MSQTSSQNRPVFRQLEDDFWLAGCLERIDLERARDAGFAAVINILPEDDELCRMSDAEAKVTCEHYGMVYRHMPVYGYQTNQEAVARAFAALVADTPGPRLVYCRSGMRVSFLWGMMRAAELGVEAVVERVSGIGFDISVIEDDLVAMAARPLSYADAAKVA